MDFGFTEEQEMLRDMMRKFFVDECPSSLVRVSQSQAPGYDVGLYAKMAEMGFCGLMVPEEFGGIASNWTDLVLFYEEAGRFLLQSPHQATNGFAVPALLNLGNPAQQAEYLPQIAAGSLTFSYALQEEGVSEDLSRITTRAVTVDGGYVLSGEKYFVPYFDSANKIIVLANSDKGPSLFIIDGNAEGISHTALKTLDGQRLGILRLDNVKVAADRLLGTEGEGLRVAQLVEKLKILNCAAMIGAADAALDLGIDYSKQRVVFGVPVGSHQVWQHKMVDGKLGLEKARWITYHAAWSANQHENVDGDVAMAALITGPAAVYATQEVVQIHGGIGATLDYDASLFYKRARAGQINLGSWTHLNDAILLQAGLDA